jgi:hypothetical protein
MRVTPYRVRLVHHRSSSTFFKALACPVMRVVSPGCECARLTALTLEVWLAHRHFRSLKVVSQNRAHSEWFLPVLYPSVTAVTCLGVVLHYYNILL